MRIQLIEPKKSSKTEKKCVCAYARVSADSKKQGESLATAGTALSFKK